MVDDMRGMQNVPVTPVVIQSTSVLSAERLVK
jgi:hypothetical protein